MLKYELLQRIIFTDLENKAYVFENNWLEVYESFKNNSTFYEKPEVQCPILTFMVQKY